MHKSWKKLILGRSRRFRQQHIYNLLGTLGSYQGVPLAEYRSDPPQSISSSVPPMSNSECPSDSVSSDEPAIFRVGSRYQFSPHCQHLRQVIGATELRSRCEQCSIAKYGARPAHFRATDSFEDWDLR